MNVDTVEIDGYYVEIVDGVVTLTTPYWWDFSRWAGDIIVIDDDVCVIVDGEVIARAPYYPGYDCLLLASCRLGKCS